MTEARKGSIQLKICFFGEGRGQDRPAQAVLDIGFKLPPEMVSRGKRWEGLCTTLARYPAAPEPREASWSAPPSGALAPGEPV